MDTVYYNHFANGLVLCPDEKVLCPRCKGLGYHEKYDTCGFILDPEDIFECHICEGLGNVDWIRNVIDSSWEQTEVTAADTWFDNWEPQLDGSFIDDFEKE
jgi:hypothetical protein